MSLYYFLPSLVTSSPTGPIIFLATHFRPSSACISFKQCDRVSHPCELTGSITVLIRDGTLRTDTNYDFITLCNYMKTLCKASQVRYRYTKVAGLVTRSHSQAISLFTQESGSDIAFCSSSCETATERHVFRKS